MPNVDLPVPGEPLIRISLGVSENFGEEKKKRGVTPVGRGKAWMVAIVAARMRRCRVHHRCTVT
jgi:hypothetical protein